MVQEWNTNTSLKLAQVDRLKPDNATPSMILLDLPLELLFRIGNEVHLCCDGKLYEIKSLRLVCKLFDKVFAPMVLSHIQIFSHQGLPFICHTNLCNFDQFCTLTTISDRLSCVKSITLGSWNWVYQPSDPLLPRYTAKRSWWKSILMPPAHFFMNTVCDPSGLSSRIREARRRNEVKQRVGSSCNVSFHLPNVQSVRWILGIPECRLSARLNARILEGLPSLTELDLSLPVNMSGSMTFDAEHEITPSITQLRNLRKITVRMWAGYNASQGSLDWLKQVIANNLNLTHVILYQTATVVPALLEIFCKVPLDRPLRLEHLRLSPRFYQITSTMIPNLRCLKSLDVRFPYPGGNAMDSIWNALQSEKIFVSEIQINRITSRFLDYLRNFDHLATLTLYGRGKADSQDQLKMLFQILEQHKLKRIKFEPFDWGRWFHHPCTRSSILKYSNLRELVLHSGYRPEYTTNADDAIQWALMNEDLEIIAAPVSQIGSEALFRLIIEGEEILFDEFRGLCLASPSPLMKGLGNRVMYRKVTVDIYDDWEEYYLYYRLHNLHQDVY